MKICALIAEYNPFHNGHKLMLDKIRRELSPDYIIVMLSGNFCERGESAVLEKHVRAKHAVLAGADLVIELPTVFATANAEVFASGAIKMLTALKAVDTLCFGVESGEKEDFLSYAKLLAEESKEFKKALKKQLDGGVSLAKARFEAVKEIKNGDIDEKLLSSPNNILAIEYVKAILKSGGNMDFYPIQRKILHADSKLHKNETSAGSIRETLKTGKKKKIKSTVPPFVYEDISTLPDYKTPVIYNLITSRAEDIENAPDCSEGLEKRIKALLKTNNDYDALVNKVTTKRYTSSRVKRIMLASLLKIDKNLTADCLNKPLYLKVLALNEKALDNLIPALKKTVAFPLLLRKSDYDALEKTAAACFEKDVLGEEIFAKMTGGSFNEYYTLIVKNEPAKKKKNR